MHESQTPSHSRSEARRCPRCDYDLRGEIASWSESCPLRGACPECGLTVEWSEFLREGPRPLWCIEFSTGRVLPVLRAAIATARRAIRPWLFWRELRLSHPVRGGRLALYVGLIIVLPMLVGYVGARASLAICVHQETERRFAAGMTVMSPDIRVVILDAVFRPRSKTSPGIVWLTGGGGGAVRYPPPRDLHEHVQSPWQGRGVALQRIDMTLWWLCMTFVFHCLILITFVAMPATLRRARVRPRHLIRAAVYGLTILSPAIILFWTTYAFAGWTDVSLSALRVCQWYIIAGVPVLTLVWWLCAARWYLHLQSSWRAAIAVWLIGLLWSLTLLCALVQPGDFLKDMTSPRMYQTIFGATPQARGGMGI